MNKPFAIQWDSALRKWLWWVPFDLTGREVVAPNADAATLTAYACVGYHVAQNPTAYCPAYQRVSVVNARMLNTRAETDEAQKVVEGTVLITNRLTGEVTRIVPALSPIEAAVSWFVREGASAVPGASVLCWDRGEGSFYVEGERPECKVVLFQGKEVADGEVGDSVDYHVRSHMNAVMHSGD